MSIDDYISQADYKRDLEFSNEQIDLMVKKGKVPSKQVGNEVLIGIERKKYEKVCQTRFDIGFLHGLYILRNMAYSLSAVLFVLAGLGALVYLGISYEGNTFSIDYFLKLIIEERAVVFLLLADLWLLFPYILNTLFFRPGKVYRFEVVFVGINYSMMLANLLVIFFILPIAVMLHFFITFVFPSVSLFEIARNNEFAAITAGIFLWFWFALVDSAISQNNLVALITHAKNESI